MINPIYIKLGAAVIIISLLTGVWWRIESNHQKELNAKYQEGYKTAESKYQAEKLQAIQDNAKKAAKEIFEISQDRDKWKKTAIDLQGRKPDVKTVVKYETKIIRENPDCSVITGFSELWNELRKNFHYRTD